MKRRKKNSSCSKKNTKKAASRFVAIFGAISLLRNKREVKNRNKNQIDDVQLKLIIV